MIDRMTVWTAALVIGGTVTDGLRQQTATGQQCTVFTFLRFMIVLLNSLSCVNDVYII